MPVTPARTKDCQQADTSGSKSGLVAHAQAGSSPPGQRSSARPLRVGTTYRTRPCKGLTLAVYQLVRRGQLDLPVVGVTHTGPSPPPRFAREDSVEEAWRGAATA